MNYRALLGLAITAALLGCADEPRGAARPGAPDTAATTQAPAITPAPGADTAVAAGEETQVELMNAQGQRVGTATLAQAGDGVRIAVQVSDLPPGPKGFHIHETGQCDAPGFQSAGGHFAPMGREHGFENPQGPHAGDLPNLNVGQNGRADTTVVARDVTLREGQQNSLLKPGGTALVIHQNRDDYRTNPSGNSGDRIACGVIGPRGGTTR